MRIVSLALAATAAAAAPAAAQTFTGPRAEVQVGYDSVGAETVPGAPDSLDGVRVGGAIGYDVALGSTLTAGVEAGIAWTLDDAERATVGATRFRVDAGRDIDLSVRLGARVAPSTLVYAKAGYANSRFSGEVRTPSGTTTVVTRAAGNEEGLRLGGGVEQALGERLYVKGEYRYTSYGDGVDRHQALVGFGVRF